jgi:hypothetical protein
VGAGNNGNGNGNGNSNSPSHHIYSHPSSELESILRMIRTEKRTGSLTIHFSQGTPAGSLEWKEKQTPSHDSDASFRPVRSLLKSGR